MSRRRWHAACQFLYNSSIVEGLASLIENRDGGLCMTTLLAREEVTADEIDMAKAAPADPILVARHAEALAAAGKDRVAFEAAFSRLKADDDLRANDVIAIAVTYRGGGVRPRTKAQALEMIEKRFVEIVRDAKKNAAAARMRPW